MKLIKYLFLCILIVLISAKESFGAGFNIKSIGGVDVDGTMYSKFWHTSLNPVITGECPPTMAVDVNLDGATSTVPCSSDGTWSYSMPAQTDGAHQLSFTNSGSTLSMTLTLGSGAAEYYDGGTGGGEKIPTVGTWEVSLGLLIGSAVMFVLGRRMLGV